MLSLKISYRTAFRRIGAFILIVLFLNVFIFHLTPFFLAFLAAMIMEKPVNFLSKYLPRLAAVLISLTVFMLIVISIITLLTSSIISEMIDLARYLPQYREIISTQIESMIQQQEEFFEVIPDEVASLIEQNIYLIYQRGERILSQTMNRILNLTFNIPGIVVFIIFTIFATFFISRDKNELFEAISKKIDISDKNKLKMVKDFTTYVRVQLLIITHTTIWVGVILSILDFPYAILLAISAGILDLIPVVGPGFILMPLSLINLFINPLHSLILLAVYLIVTSFRPFLESNMLARSIGVHPLILLLGLYVGLTLMGFQGIILAPLSIIIFKVLLVADVGI